MSRPRRLRASGRSLHPDEAPVRASLPAALERGTAGHYLDAAQYDHEYARRRDDIAFYLKVAAAHAGRGPILELGCGSGRLTVPLLRQGHAVVGIDASAEMLAACRARVERAGLGDRARLHQADFRALGPRSALGRARFPLVLCPFNAFQHLYEREDIEACLAGVRAHLGKGGLFVFDLMNPDLRWLSRDPHRRWDRTRYKDPRTGAAMTYATKVAYDAPLQIAFMTVHHEPVRGQRGRRFVRHLTHRHFFPRELEALLHYNGLEVVRREGDFGGGPLEGSSEQQVLWCRARR
jgi:SAM-dependent methyltransferase